MKKITIRLPAFLIMGTMALLIANKAIFTHSHVLPDGQLVLHAHPHEKNNGQEPFTSHHHTQAELIFLQHLETLFPLIFLAIILVVNRPAKKYPLFSAAGICPAPVFPPKGRSPPVF